MWKDFVWFYASLFCLISGAVDLDWMIVAPRFNDWYFSVDFWEFFPGFQVGWWFAYLFTVLRIAVGLISLTVFFVKRRVS